MPDLTIYIIAILSAVVLIFVVRARKASHAEHLQALAREEVCEHLRDALEELLAAGGTVRRVGQIGPDMPLEIHFTQSFDPDEVMKELNLKDPVEVSDRNVIFCKEHWCELHPG